ncbi:MAG: FAD-dependent oxidoreductase [Eubacteriaceae bacterium]|nr:FAD-dependent oxidoreductase [Eubacteriaceae bacterium]
MDTLYDVAIVGCGPAGISAAINCKVRNKNIIFFGSEFCTAKMYKSPQIFNYLGYPEITGAELRELFIKHALQAGVKFTKEKVSMVLPMDDEFSIAGSDNTYRAKAVILATGITFTKAIKGEEEFLGKGVGYCATCDAPLYRGKTVAMLAYDKEAEEESSFLSEICKKVYFVPLYNDTGALNDKIEVVKDTPIEIIGENKVTHLVLKNSKIEVDGVFIIKEVASPEQLVPGVEMDGPHIKVNRNMETNIKGLYAAGDCAGKPYQLSKAGGEGQLAALNAIVYIDNKK